MTEVAQVQTDLQRLSDRPLSDDVGSLWQRVETLEKADWQGQVTAVQQWVKDLDASAEALHDRTRHLDYIQEQLVALQEWVSAQSQCDRGRVAIFIDGTNLFSAAQKLGIEIDYAKLLAVLTAGSPLFRACFYMGVDSANKKQQDFLSSLRRHGYRVVSKELVRRADNSKKANLDVEIALDLISLVGAYDTAVLVSDNEEFACAIKAVSGRGARVEVVSLQSRKSNELIDVADCYINLETIKDEICKGSIPMPVKTPKD
ncbi:MAG: NYN domain-containing protein [Aphanothece sp. CMT-3BRIN-NPC111]|nr:NYN domain-containing protein [Aphanothece sp. CMT-3BRIN-NPC111]